MIIYLDIETAAVGWDSLPADRQSLWNEFATNKHRDETYEIDDSFVATRWDAGWEKACWEDKAALHPEFGLVACISFAIDDGKVFSLPAAKVEDEPGVLSRFADGLRKNPMHNLCAHNGKGFDFHWLARRMVIHGVKLPRQLNTQGLKPWETSFIDTQEMWGFGDMRRTVRLDVLCASLGIPSPKDAMCGAEVPQAWRDGRIEEIVTYCEKDVEALREVYKRLDAA